MTRSSGCNVFMLMVVTYIFDYKIHKFTELNEFFFLCGF